MKKMPYSFEAEQSVLGAVLIDQNAIDRISQKIVREDFYHVNHANIFSAMIDLHKRNIDIDYATLLDNLDDKNLTGEIGGIEYLMQLANMLPTAENVDSYVEIVKNKSLSRQLIQMATKIAENSYDQELNIDELFDFTEREVFEVTKKRKAAEFRGITNVVSEVITGIEKHKNRDGFIIGHSSGFTLYDEYTLGLQDGQLIILAARPSMGKSAFAVNIAYNVAEKGKHVAVFSLEMSAEQIVTRMLSSVSGINSMNIQSGRINTREWVQLEHAASMLKRMNIYFDDTSSTSVSDVYTKCRQLKQEGKLDFVVIDYLQLLTGSSNYGGNRVTEVSEISRKLKNLARDLEVPVLALSQLSRGVENRIDKRPNMADLRESGSIEQDADIVMFMYRDDYYNRENSEKPNLVDIIISKNRSGSVGGFDLLFVKECGLFRNLSPSKDEEEF